MRLQQTVSRRMKYQLFNFSGPHGNPRVGVQVGGKHLHFGEGAIEVMESGTSLTHGDSVRVWIDGLGELETTPR